MFVSYIETPSPVHLTEFFPEDYRFVRKGITVWDRKGGDEMISTVCEAQTWGAII